VHNIGGVSSLIIIIEEKTIKQYADFVVKKINSKLKIKFDQNRSMDGTPRKILDCSLARSYGWKPKFSLEKGFMITYNDFLRKKLF
jgi:GDP-L-fucose synthase